jgi:hypothetical protein
MPAVGACSPELGAPVMRQNQIAVALGIVNLLLLAALIGRTGVGAADAAADGASPVLRAERIELVDATGVVRAEIRTEADGATVLRLRDRDGNIRVKLAADAFGSGLLLADERTEVGVHILSGVSRLTSENETMITLATSDGAKRVIRPGE